MAPRAQQQQGTAVDPEAKRKIVNAGAQHKDALPIPVAVEVGYPRSVVAHVGRSMPNNEQEIRDWIKESQIDDSVANRLISDGFKDATTLKILAELGPKDIKSTLGLSDMPTAVKLKAALNRLYGEEA